jgi:hypothetical protein
MTDAAYTPIGVIQPPNLTTAAITALGTLPYGAIFFDTTTDSVSVNQRAMLKRLNQPYHFSGSDTATNILKTASATITISLDKKGYTGGWVIIRSPFTAAGSSGKCGALVLIRPGSASGVLAAASIDSYSSVFNSAAGDSYFTEARYSTAADFIKLSNCYIGADGDSVNLTFYNTNTTTTKTLSVYYAGYVF